MRRYPSWAIFHPLFPRLTLASIKWISQTKNSNKPGEAGSHGSKWHPRRHRRWRLFFAPPPMAPRRPLHRSVATRVPRFEYLPHRSIGRNSRESGSERKRKRASREFRVFLLARSIGGEGGGGRVGEGVAARHRRIRFRKGEYETSVYEQGFEYFCVHPFLLRRVVLFDVRK